MAVIVVSSEVHYKDQFGRFTQICEEAAEAAVQEVLDRGAQMARALAPEGKTGELLASIKPLMLSRTHGVLVADAPHAHPQEMGRQPTFQPAYGNPEQTVFNPGHGAQPFLRPANEFMSSILTETCAKHYPG